MKSLIALFFAVAFSAQAQTYIGASLGYGQTGNNTESEYASPTLQIHQQVRSEAGSVFIGHRFGMFSVEGGLMRLPRYNARMSTSDYTAYLGKNVGITTAYATDSVKAKATYLRGAVHWKNAYVFGGVARTVSDQYTYGVYDGSNVGVARYHTSNTKPMYGVGLQTGGFRLEYVEILGATENRATGKRNIRMVQAGYSWSFK